MSEPFSCAVCDLTHPHEHHQFYAPNGELREAIAHHSTDHPRAEVRDPDTGEVIFPAIKGPLTVIQGDKS